MPLITDGLQDPDYIGDGVYVGHDGYQIWLRTERITEEGQAIIHEIALEPGVWNALLAYRNHHVYSA